MFQPPIYEHKMDDGSLILSVNCRGRAKLEGPGHEGKVFEISIQLSTDQQMDLKFVNSQREKLRQAYTEHRVQFHGQLN